MDIHIGIMHLLNRAQKCCIKLHLGTHLNVSKSEAFRRLFDSVCLKKQPPSFSSKDGRF